MGQVPRLEAQREEKKSIPKVEINIVSRSGEKSFQFDSNFSGKLFLTFHEGGIRAVELTEKLK